MSAAQIAGLLSGITYPAQRWEIVAWAQYNGASPMMIEALGDIPARDYPGPHHIAAAALPLAAASTCCRHRRHPRHCPLHHSHTQHQLVNSTG